MTALVPTKQKGKTSRRMEVRSRSTNLLPERHVRSLCYVHPCMQAVPRRRLVISVGPRATIEQPKSRGCRPDRPDFLFAVVLPTIISGVFSFSFSSLLPSSLAAECGLHEARRAFCIDEAFINLVVWGAVGRSSLHGREEGLLYNRQRQ